MRPQLPCCQEADFSTVPVRKPDDSRFRPQVWTTGPKLAPCLRLSTLVKTGREYCATQSGVRFISWRDVGDVSQTSSHVLAFRIFHSKCTGLSALLRIQRLGTVYRYNITGIRPNQAALRTTARHPCGGTESGGYPGLQVMRAAHAVCAAQPDESELQVGSDSTQRVPKPYSGTDMSSGGNKPDDSSPIVCQKD